MVPSPREIRSKARKAQLEAKDSRTLDDGMRSFSNGLGAEWAPTCGATPQIPSLPISTQYEQALPSPPLHPLFCSFPHRASWDPGTTKRAHSAQPPPFFLLGTQHRCGMHARLCGVLAAGPKDCLTSCGLSCGSVSLIVYLNLGVALQWLYSPKFGVLCDEAWSTAEESFRVDFFAAHEVRFYIILHLNIW